MGKRQLSTVEQLERVSGCIQPPLMSVTSLPYSGSALRVAMAGTTATPTSPVLWTQRTSGGCSTTAGTSSRECTCGSTNSCDGRPPSSAFCVSLHYSASLRNPSSSSSSLPHKETLNNPRPPLLSRTMKYYWSVSNPLPLLNSLSFCTSFFFSLRPIHPHFTIVKWRLGNKVVVCRLFFFIFLSIFPFECLIFVIPLSLGLPPFLPLCVLLFLSFSLDLDCLVWTHKTHLQDLSVEAVCVYKCVMKTGRNAMWASASVCVCVSPAS